MRITSSIIAFTFFVLCGASIAFLPQTSSAQVSFEGKIITIIVPFRRGGGTDRWARFWANRLKETLEGHPKVIVNNVATGSAVTAVNVFANKNSEDSLTLLASSASVMYPYLLKDAEVRFDLTKMDSLLISPTGGVVYAHPSIVKQHQGNALDKDSRIIIATQGPKSIGSMLLLGLDLLGVKFEADYEATGSIMILESFEKGSINLDLQTTPVFKINVEPLINNDKAIALFSLGVADANGNITRDPAFPNLPHFLEYLAATTSGEPNEILIELWKKMFLAGFPTQKMLLINEAADEGSKNAYHTALQKAINQQNNWPDQKKKILGNYVSYTGVKAQRLFEQTLNFDSSLVNFYNDWIVNTLGIN